MTYSLAQRYGCSASILGRAHVARSKAPFLSAMIANRDVAEEAIEEQVEKSHRVRVKGCPIDKV